MLVAPSAVAQFPACSEEESYGCPASEMPEADWASISRDSMPSNDGSAASFYELGKQFHFGLLGSKPDAVRAQEYYQQALSLGEKATQGWAAYRLGELFHITARDQDAPLQNAQDYYKQALGLKNPITCAWAAYRLGECFHQRLSGLENFSGMHVDFADMLRDIGSNRLFATFKTARPHELNLEAAKRYYKQALKTDTSLAQAWASYRLGELSEFHSSSDEKHYLRAQEYYESTLDCEHKVPSAWATYRLGELLQLRAIQTSSASRLPFCSRGMLKRLLTEYFSPDLKIYRRAKACYKKALAADEKALNAWSYYQLGELCYALDQPQAYCRARTYYEKAMACGYPALRANAAYRLGTLYDRGLGGNQDTQHAQSYYEISRKLHPSSSDFLSNNPPFPIHTFSITYFILAMVLFGILIALVHG